MKWTNEIWHQFRNFLPFSAFFGHFLWETRDISSFSENIREILTKFHQNFAEKWPNSLTKIGMKWNFISFRPKSLTVFLLEFRGVGGAKAKKSCRARKMLKKMSPLSLSRLSIQPRTSPSKFEVFHFIISIVSLTSRLSRRFEKSSLSTRPAPASASICAFVNLTSLFPFVSSSCQGEILAYESSRKWDPTMKAY